MSKTNETPPPQAEKSAEATLDTKALSGMSQIVTHIGFRRGKPHVRRCRRESQTMSNRRKTVPISLKSLSFETVRPLRNERGFPARAASIAARPGRSVPQEGRFATRPIRRPVATSGRRAVPERPCGPEFPDIELIAGPPEIELEYFGRDFAEGQFAGSSPEGGVLRWIVVPLVSVG